MIKLIVVGLLFMVSESGNSRKVWLDIYNTNVAVDSKNIVVYCVTKKDSVVFQSDAFGLKEGNIQKGSILYIILAHQKTLKIIGINNKIEKMGMSKLIVNINDSYNGNCLLVQSWKGDVRYDDLQCSSEKIELGAAHSIIISSPEIKFDPASKRFTSQNKKFESKLNMVGLPN